jgi:hypothetical protein
MIKSSIRLLALFACATALAVAGCGDSDNTASNATTPTESAPAEKVSIEAEPADRDRVSTWPIAWCKAEVGMTRQEMADLMGPPVKAFTLDQAAEGGFDPQMTWTFAEWGFGAFFDSEDKVRQLDVYDTDLSAEKKAQIKCDFSRK